VCVCVCDDSGRPSLVGVMRPKLRADQQWFACRAMLGQDERGEVGWERMREGLGADLQSTPAPSCHADGCLTLISSYTEVYSVIYDSGSVPEKSIFSPRGTLPTIKLSR